MDGQWTLLARDRPPLGLLWAVAVFCWLFRPDDDRVVAVEVDWRGARCRWLRGSLARLSGGDDCRLLAPGLDGCRWGAGGRICCLCADRDEVRRTEALGSVIDLVEVCCERVWRMLLSGDDERVVVVCAVRWG